MANTFELISSVTVGSGGATSIDFTSIPATYTDLALYLSLQGLETGISFNGSSSNLSDTVLFAYGASNVGSNSSTSKIRINTNTLPANTFGSAFVYIPNYLSSVNKSLSSESVIEDNGTTYNGMYITAGLWSNTAAINRVTLTPSSGNYNQYSTAYLYGVKNA